jgi:hypothetical protein
MASNSKSLKVAAVYVQTNGGVIAHEAMYKAWYGFRKREFPIELFEYHTIYSGTLPLDRTTLVVGGVPIVQAAFRQIGIPVPPADDLPECLAAYRGRRVWASTWAELRSELERQLQRQGEWKPLFVKPLRAYKAFPGYVIYNEVGLIASASQPGEMEVLVSEHIEFVSEWRCFVLRNKVVGLSPYNGNVLVYPNSEVIRAAIRDYRWQSPVAYAIDFGVTYERETLLVEVNDAYGLGCYGCDDVSYTRMLEARWLELATTTSTNAQRTAPPTHFFPPLSLGSENDFHAFMEGWFAGHLVSMGEPPLYPPCPEGTTVYRFLWLRTFDPAVAIRVTRSSEEARVIAKKTNGLGGYEPGDLVENRERVLSEDEWRLLADKVAEVSFWDLESNAAMGLDGSEWILEGVRNGKYHFVYEWSPKKGPIRELGTAFLEVSKLSESPIY